MQAPAAVKARSLVRVCGYAGAEKQGRNQFVLPCEPLIPRSENGRGISRGSRNKLEKWSLHKWLPWGDASTDRSLYIAYVSFGAVALYGRILLPSTSCVGGEHKVDR